MKEFSIEQKAKRYDEALEKAKNYHSPETECNVRIVMENIFLELRENEDVRIIQDIITTLSMGGACEESALHPGAHTTLKEAIAWLEEQKTIDVFDEEEREFADNVDSYRKEIDAAYQKGFDEGVKTTLEKQGEQKSDKVEPKFKVGDYVVGKYISGYISEVRDDCYLLDYQGFPIDKQNNYHLWTINDAKDGDVLACNEEILLFKSYSVQGRISLHCWYNGQTNNFHSKEVVDTLMTTRNKICPATKEQRDLLFQKMHEAGYEWDADKKELKKIEQKSAWSGEDEAKLKSACALIRNTSFKGNEGVVYSTINWLKSLRPQKQWKPTKEELRALENVFSLDIDSWDEDILRELYKQLKQL